MTGSFEWRRPLGLALCLALLAVWPDRAGAQDASEATWAEIREQAVGAKPIQDGAQLLTLKTPARAEDAAIVPIEIVIHVPAGDERRVKGLTVVIDENPSPVVGRFAFGEGRTDFAFSTRVRVNSYSYLRVVAEGEDGQLYMSKAYIKAAGGCSAPAVKDPAAANANVGDMRFRVIAGRGEAQVQMRHPNYSGLQMDQVTRLFTPAWYVETLAVRQGTRTLFTMEGGISISEDPTFRFSYAPNNEPVRVEARDTSGRMFRRTFPGADAS